MQQFASISYSPRPRVLPRHRPLMCAVEIVRLRMVATLPS